MSLACRFRDLAWRILGGPMRLVQVAAYRVRDVWRMTRDAWRVVRDGRRDARIAPPCSLRSTCRPLRASQMERRERRVSLNGWRYVGHETRRRLDRRRIAS